MLEDALSAYRALGMPTYAAEAERLQRQAQAQGVPKRPQPNDQLRCARQLHCRRRLNEQVQPLGS
jgi:hypothetical protein